jgi:hypothetical protein
MKKLFAMASMLVFLHGPVQCDAGVLAEMCNAAIYRPECIWLPVIGGLVASIVAGRIMESRHADARLKKKVPIVVGLSTFATTAVALCWWCRFPVTTSIGQPLGRVAVIGPNVDADELKEMFQSGGTPNTVVERVRIQKGSRIKRILDGTFNGCPRLNSVTLPACVKEVGDRSFNDCARLVEVVIPGAEEIGDYAFQDCASLTKVVIPEAKKIGAYAFAGCPLCEFEAPKLVSIGQHAFSNCSALGSITLGDSIKYVGGGAFENCSELNKINSKRFSDIRDELHKLGDCCSYNDGMLKLRLGESALILDGMVVFEPEAFAGCNSLKSIVITFGLLDYVSRLEEIGDKLACIMEEVCCTTGIIQKAEVVAQIVPLLLSGLDIAIGGFIAHKGTVDGLKVVFPEHIKVTYDYDII